MQAGGNAQLAKIPAFRVELGEFQLGLGQARRLPFDPEPAFQGSDGLFLESSGYAIFELGDLRVADTRAPRQFGAGQAGDQAQFAQIAAVGGQTPDDVWSRRLFGGRLRRQCRRRRWLGRRDRLWALLAGEGSRQGLMRLIARLDRLLAGTIGVAEMGAQLIDFLLEEGVWGGWRLGSEARLALFPQGQLGVPKTGAGLLQQGDGALGRYLGLASRVALFLQGAMGRLGDLSVVGDLTAALDRQKRVIGGAVTVAGGPADRRLARVNAEAGPHAVFEKGWGGKSVLLNCHAYSAIRSPRLLAGVATLPHITAYRKATTQKRVFPLDHSRMCFYPIPMTKSHDVAAFHRRFGQGYDGPPRVLPPEMLDFRSGFLHEELREFDHAVAIGDQAKLLDALVDLTYVAIGTADLMGSDFDEAWRRVHVANMAKIPAADGTFKIRKPEGWQPPDLRDLVVANDRQPEPDTAA